MRPDRGPGERRTGGGVKHVEVARSFTRGAFYLSLEKAVGLVSGLAYVMLVSRWMGPTKYGLISLALAYTGFATSATGNLEVYLERYAAEYETHGAMRTLRRSLILTLGSKVILGALAAVVLLILSSAFVMLGRRPELAFLHLSDKPELEFLIPVLCLTVLFDGLGAAGRSTLYGLQQYRYLFALSAPFNVAKTVMVGWMWWSRMGLVQLAAGLAVISVVQGTLFAVVPLWMLRRARDREDAEPPGRRTLFRAMLDYCLPLLGARVTFLSGQNLSKIVVGWLFTATDVGYFSFAFQMTERFVEVAYTVPYALLPSLTQLVARGERARLATAYERSSRVIQAMACALALGLFTFARELTVPVGSHLFEPSIPVLRILALVPLFRTPHQTLTMLFQAMKRTDTVLRLALIKFVVEFGSYFALVPAIGLTGAGWANVTGAAAAYAGALVVGQRLVPEHGARRLTILARAMILVAPLLVLVMVVDWALQGWAGLLLRVAIVAGGGIGLFAFGLVLRDDLTTLSAIPLAWQPMRRVRDLMVASVDWLARAIEPRRIL